jgi:hypothetical protein
MVNPAFIAGKHLIFPNPLFFIFITLLNGSEFPIMQQEFLCRTKRGIQAKSFSGKSGKVIKQNFSNGLKS